MLRCTILLAIFSLRHTILSMARLAKALLIDRLEIGNAGVECIRGECILTVEVKTMALTHVGIAVNYNGTYGTQGKWD